MFLRRVSRKLECRNLLTFRIRLKKTLTNSDGNNDYDFIGPPNAVSNLRPIKYKIPPNESRLEKELRCKRMAVQEWNERFWTKHNTDFVTERESFKLTELNKKGNEGSLNAEEMSVFYKQFLDKNWKTHMKYNFEWYLKNIEITFLDFRVKLHKLVNKS